MRITVKGACVLGILFLTAPTLRATAPEVGLRDRYFIIRVVDAETGRGVPLVELSTTNAIRLYTDSQGLIAFYEPGLMNQRVFFCVRSHGYECRRKVFDARGVTLLTTPGDSITVQITRINIAERLYRITGQGIYDQSVLAGYPVPIQEPLLNGQVMGQDGGLAIMYRGRIYWFWSDTGQLPGPLGNFACSGATSALPGSGGLDPNLGVDFAYFVNESGSTRPMVNIPGEGLKWLNLPMLIPDSSGRDRLIALFVRVNGLVETYERGLALFNDSLDVFERLLSFDLNAPISLDGQICVFDVMIDGIRYEYFSVLDDQRTMYRVRADWAHVTDPGAYENFSCLVPGSAGASGPMPLDRDSTGRLTYGWKANTASIGLAAQQELIKSGSLRPDEVWMQMEAVETGQPLKLHSGTVAWNAYRRRWIMLVQQDVGEVWFAEGDTPTGPWVYARKVVGHDRYNFYLPRHHALFDQEGGRLIYFEGTYSNMFSGNPDPTPRYDYNQIMYRLALDDARLTLPAPVYRVSVEGRGEQWLMRDAVDSLHLWERVLEIPFFAIPPERSAESWVPLYSKRDGRGERLTLSGSSGGRGTPLCFVLPADSELAPERDPISGTWKCEASFPDGSTMPFELELSLSGIKISGPEITGGRWEPGTGEIRLQMDDYAVSGKLKGKTLSGDFMKDDGTDSGTWTGTGRTLPTRQPPSPSVALLYEYRHQNREAWLYSVKPDLGDPQWVRSPAPICRVWRNPTSLVLLDHNARPVPSREP